MKEMKTGHTRTTAVAGQASSANPAPIEQKATLEQPVAPSAARQSDADISQTEPVLRIPSILLEGDEPSWTEQAGMGRKYAVGPAPGKTAPVCESGRLPQSYGTGALLLVARDPHCLYLHWDMSPEQQQKHITSSAEGHLVARIHADSPQGPLAAEAQALPESQHLFVPVGKAGAKYVAELGYYGPNRRWVTITTSSSAATPAEGPSEQRATQVASLSSESQPAVGATETSPEAASISGPTAPTWSAAKTKGQAALGMRTKDWGSTAEAAEKLSTFVPSAVPAPAAQAQPGEPPPAWSQHLGSGVEDAPGVSRIAEEKNLGQAMRAVPAPSPTMVSAAGMDFAHRPSESFQADWTAPEEFLLAEAGYKRPHWEDVNRGEGQPGCPTWPARERAPSSPMGPGFERSLARVSRGGAPGVIGGQSAEIPGPCPEEGGHADFRFCVNAELVIYGATESDAQVTIGGRRIRLRSDGSFSYRFALPDGDYDLDIEAMSPRGDYRCADLRFIRRSAYSGDVEMHPQESWLRTPEARNVS